MSNTVILHIDLSTYTSDGTGQLPQHSNLTRTSNAQFLNNLSGRFNAMGGHSMVLLGHPVNFVGAPPRGYAMFNHIEIGKRELVEIHGHPSGRAFDSVNVFCRHVASVIRDNVAHCTCQVCVVVGVDAGAGSDAAVYGTGHSSISMDITHAD